MEMNWKKGNTKEELEKGSIKSKGQGIKKE
jgi:hypothetical protein